MRIRAEAIIGERMVIAMIVINTIAIFLRAFPWLHARYEFPLFAVDYICTVFFILEMALKVRLRGWGGYLSTWWDRFDFAVVMVSSPLLLSPFMDLQGFGVVLLLRLGRLLRLFRLLRFVPDADRLWNGIKRGLRASVGVLLGLALYNFALGLAACYLFGDIEPTHFGDPITSVYSLFKVFTVEGWYDIPDHISTTTSPMMGYLVRGFFVFAVTTGGILGLSMANAVFVDEMVIDNTEFLEERVAELTAVMREMREENATLLLQHGDAIARLEARLGRALDEQRCE